ncbi:MAG: sulfite exporter TauE/SafE family protein [Candidatus Hadarchaeota archaeon]
MVADLLAAALLGAAAVLYTMGGFAGGSFFLAILLFSGTPVNQAALYVLIMNLFSAGSSLLRWKAHASRELLWFLAGSLPAAFLGGLVQLSNSTLRATIGLLLAVGGGTVIFSTAKIRKMQLKVPVRVAIGAAIGFVAGLTGIGGGIYLAPVLVFLGVAKPKTIAATTTVFILLNSVSGLLARTTQLAALAPSLLLVAAIPAVFVAAQVGSYIGSRRFSQANVRRTIGAILVVIGSYLGLGG